MAIYITGDLHGDIDISKLSNKNFKEGKQLTRSDYLIICGDFGFPWKVKENGEIYKNEQYWIKWLSAKPYTILFVDGNHENHNLLNSMPIIPWRNGYIHKISDNIFHLMRGNIFQIDGLSVFAFGGAKSHDKQYRKENVSWFAQEEATYEEMNYGTLNLERYNYTVDVVITHTPPRSVINSIGFSDSSCNVASYLDFIQCHTNYKHWYCGHMHKEFSIQSLKITLLYNSIIKIK